MYLVWVDDRYMFAPLSICMHHPNLFGAPHNICVASNPYKSFNSLKPGVHHKKFDELSLQAIPLHMRGWLVQLNMLSEWLNMGPLHD